jgi:glycosyltransferase involved in cell wall biosynthesis
MVMVKISLIVPCYNEEANIQKGVLDKIGNYSKLDKFFAEVIIVDDGSTDKSKKIIKDYYLPKFSHFRLIENQHQGKAFAVIEGIKQAKNPYVMFMDIDLATPIEESQKLIKEINKKYDIVIGSRKAQRDGAPLTRKIMAFGMMFVREVFIGLKGVRDTQCGFKLFKTDSALNIIKRLKVFKNKSKIRGSSVSAAFDLEFLFLAHKLGSKIKEIPVTWKHVETKNVNFLKDTVETLQDIIKIKVHDIGGSYDR